MKNILLVLLSCFILSCENIASEIILLENIKEDIIKLEEKMELTALQKSELENLSIIAEGREEYIETINKRVEDFDYDEYVVNESDFSNKVDLIQAYFIKNEISYEMFLDQIEHYTNENSIYNENIQPLYEKIDKYSVEEQNKVDKKLEEIKSFNANLANMASFDILSIENKEVDYTDNVILQIKYVNNTKEVIEAMGFKLHLYNKFNEEITEIYCSVSDSFTGEDSGYWYYDKWDRPEIYKKLRNIKLRHISKVEGEIYKININGEVLEEKWEYEVMDYKYKTPETLTGYSSYLAKENPLYIEKETLDNEFDLKMEEEASAYIKYSTIAYSLLDFSL